LWLSNRLPMWNVSFNRARDEMAASDDRWVVVSGAGGSLGGALAAHYGSRGRRVLALDRKFGPEHRATLKTTTNTVDLLADEEVRSVLAQTIALGSGISLLVNAVGLIWSEPLLAMRGGKVVEHGLESWRNVIDANLTAAFVVAKRVATHMTKNGGGCIVNFSSIASGGNPGQAAYSAAKAGIEGLTRTMAVELGPLGVRANALALGFIDVATTRQALTDKRLQQYSEKTPLGRLGRLDDVVSAVEFLASNTFVNGAIIQVDGGLRF
jgi:3-oxoacyl-[acyl-carrier protein] reductase